MLTFESIKKERPEMRDGDIAAALRFAACFDCLDSATYAEAHEKICASISMIGDELDSVDDEEEQRSILRERYKNL